MTSKKIIIIDNNKVIVKQDDAVLEEHPIGSAQAFEILTKLWLRAGWDLKHVYTFSWLGRPVIQLPEDMLRIQEVIYQIKPDVIVETGVAHGGSLVFYSSICKAIGKGRVIGVDVEIRPHNRKAIEAHELYSYITLVEGSSINQDIVKQVKKLVEPGEEVLVLLDSNHTKDHVLSELNAYSGLVSPGSYIVACDGIMKDLVGAPRSDSDWGTNNPYQAAKEFLKSHPEFELEQPEWPFNESNGLCENVVTYWPGAWLRKK